MVAHRRALSALLVLTGLLGLAGCGPATTEAASGSRPLALRLGYFPNLTHATAIVGLSTGTFTERLGTGVRLEPKTFSAGPAAIEALFSGAIDAAYLGPSPTVNAWQKSHGEAIRVVAGAASGGVFLVVRPGIAGPDQLTGARLATPQLGNTQDVALRYWLRQHGLVTTARGGGDVSILPQENAQVVTAFASGAIDGAWVPEPYASKLVAAGGHVLVDERDLWPDGRFVVTNLVVRKAYLDAHRDVVKRLVAGGVAANARIAAHPVEARVAVCAGIGKITGQSLDPAQLATAWSSITFLDDPVADSLRDGARHAEEVGLLGHVDLAGIYDLSLLNEVLAANGVPEVGS